MTANKLKRFLFAAIFGLLCLAPSTAVADSEGIVRYGVSQQVLQDEFVDGNGQNGYLPVRLTGYRESNGATRYFTRWVRNTQGIAWQQRSYRTLAQFNAFNTTFQDQGYILADVSGYETEDGIRYAGLWHENTADLSWIAFPDLTKDQMQFLHDTIGQQGWRPHRIEGYALNGQSRFISVWYYLPNAGYYWHSKLTAAQYQDKFDEYKAQGFAPFHLDSHTVGGVVYYSGIWKKVNTSWRVRTGRAWNVFQRYYNNYWSDGFNIDNFYAAETPNGVRFGGVWFFDGVPDINAGSSLYLRVRKEVDGAPARGGAAIINLNTGQETMLHADQTFAVASVIKIGILYALLREVDAGEISLSDTINSGAQYGCNQPAPNCQIAGGWLQTNTNYTVLQMAQFMIRSSNNWATNRLIDALGRDGLTGFQVINQHLADPAGLNLKVTRLYRYMTGTGAPSVAGNASSNDDHAEGIENLSTPREMATLLKRVRNEDLLDPLSKLTFWATLKMDGDNDGLNEKLYVPGVVTPLFPQMTIFNKDGSLSSVRIVKADAGAMVFNNNTEVVVYAIFMDEISDDPDTPGVASQATVNAAVTALQNAGKEVATEYNP